MRKFGVRAGIYIPYLHLKSFSVCLCFQFYFIPCILIFCSNRDIYLPLPYIQSLTEIFFVYLLLVANFGECPNMEILSLNISRYLLIFKNHFNKQLFLWDYAHGNAKKKEQSNIKD